jgi:hypothetical protein
VTATVPADSAGVTTVRVWALTTLRPVPASVPKSTMETPMKSEPEMVTLVPPDVVPLRGERLWTAGSVT